MQTDEILGVARSFYYWGGWIAVWLTESPLLEYPKYNPFKGEKSIDVTLRYQVLEPDKS